jgi:hypothetical protein
MFFDQIKDIDGSIKALKDHLVNIGGCVDQQLDQLDDIAGHIIALEAIMVQVLKQTTIDVEAAKEWVRTNTETSTGKTGGSTKARTVVEQLCAR